MAKLQVQDLIPGKTYKVQVRAVNDNGEYSEWSNTTSFTVPLNIDETSGYAVAPETVIRYKTIVGDSSVSNQSGLIKSSGFNGELQNDNNLNMSGAINPSTGLPYSGDSGWAIDYSGNAIFNNILARGIIEASGGIIGGFSLGTESMLNDTLSLWGRSINYYIKSVTTTTGSAIVTVSGGTSDISIDDLGIIIGSDVFDAGTYLKTKTSTTITMSSNAKLTGSYTMYFYKPIMKVTDPGYAGNPRTVLIWGNGSIMLNDIVASDSPGAGSEIGIKGKVRFFNTTTANSASGNIYNLLNMANGRITTTFSGQSGKNLTVTHNLNFTAATITATAENDTYDLVCTVRSRLANSAVIEVATRSGATFSGTVYLNWMATEL